MTLGWLRRVLENFPDETELFILDNNQLHRLSGSVDKIILTYSTEEQPDIRKGEIGIGLKAEKPENKGPKLPAIGQN